jgi:[protein-PII] uridylyltransferase
VKPVDAATIKRVRAQLVDDPDLSGRSLARRLSQQADSWFESLAASLPTGWALVATGGYARGVLCPGSDIDVALIHPKKVTDAIVRDVAEGLWYPMWDAGLKLSPAAHTVSSMLSLAADDLDTATAVLRVRTLGGDPSLGAALQAGALEQWRKRPFGWMHELLESARGRWARCGDVASLLEPDLKDGRGGLRDFDMIRWSLLTDRADVAAALESPFEDLAGPADLLLAARCELHRATGRPGNVLLLQDQDRVADTMGFADADSLMLTLAGAAQAIEWATDRFWRRAERLIRASGRVAKNVAREALTNGVETVDGEVRIAADADVDEPSYVFRFAAAAAHAGAPMSAASLRMLASRGVAPGAPWTERTQRAFLSLLGAGQGAVAAVEALERYGLFSRYLPEWRAVRHLPQRNAFHTYTVDRHLLQTVANASELVRDVRRPDLLLVGALLHDIGKGYPGDHTEAGVAMVDDICRRMGFVDDDVDVVRALIEFHLLLPETATRRDLSDPRTAVLVAEAVTSAERLELLHALTVADSMATGPAAWSSWKGSLIEELVAATLQVLRGATASAVSTEFGGSYEDLADRVEATGVAHMEVDNGDEFDVLRVACHDRAGLFATLAGVVTLHGLDVVAAAASTAPNGVAVDEFRLTRTDTTDQSWSKVEHDLRAALDGSIDIDARLDQRLRTSRRRRRPQAATPARREVLVSNDVSETTTVVEVRAPDEPAMLYRLSHALTEFGTDIRSAKVATLGHEVVDVFYVTRNGHKLEPVEFDAVRRQVLAALAPAA